MPQSHLKLVQPEAPADKARKPREDRNPFEVTVTFKRAPQQWSKETKLLVEGRRLVLALKNDNRCHRRLLAFIKEQLLEIAALCDEQPVALDAGATD